MGTAKLNPVYEK